MNRDSNEPDFDLSADMRLLELQRNALGLTMPQHTSTWQNRLATDTSVAVIEEHPAVGQTAVLNVETTATPASGVIPGAVVTMALSLTNEGAATARGVVLGVPIPGGSGYRPGSFIRDGRAQSDDAAEAFFGAGIEIAEIAAGGRCTFVWKLSVKVGTKPLIAAPQIRASASAVIGARPLSISRKDQARAAFASEVSRLDAAIYDPKPLIPVDIPADDLPIYELDSEEELVYEAANAALSSAAPPIEVELDPLAEHEPTAEPVLAVPAYVEPVLAEPAYVEPVLAEPAYVEPVLAEPAYVEPVLAEPAYAEPEPEPELEIEHVDEIELEIEPEDEIELLTPEPEPEHIPKPAPKARKKPKPKPKLQPISEPEPTPEPVFSASELPAVEPEPVPDPTRTPEPLVAATKPVVEVREAIALYGQFDRATLSFFERTFNGSKPASVLQHCIFGGALACPLDAAGDDVASLKIHLSAQSQVLHRIVLHEKLGRKEPIVDYSGELLADLDKLQPTAPAAPTLKRDALVLVNEPSEPTINVIRQIVQDRARWDFVKARQLTLALQAQHAVGVSAAVDAELANALRAYAQASMTALQRLFVRIRIDRTTGVLAQPEPALDTAARALLVALQRAFA